MSGPIISAEYLTSCSLQTTEPVQVITRILPNQPRTITRSVPDTMPTSRSAPHASVTRMVQNVRCVSPDSTTDIPPSKLYVILDLLN